MSKLKELWARLDVKYATIGGAIVVTTTLGTCHLSGPSEESTEPVLEEPAEEAKPEEAEAEAEPA